MMKKMMNYSLNFEKFGIIKTLFAQSLNKYLRQKMNTLRGSNFQYLVTIHIDSIQMTPNTIAPISQLPNCKGRLLALPTNISLGWK